MLQPYIGNINAGLLNRPSKDSVSIGTGSFLESAPQVMQIDVYTSRSFRRQAIAVNTLAKITQGFEICVF